MPWPYVELMPSDVGYADYLANWRRRRGSKLTPRTKAPTDWEEALKLDIRGARCETAYYLYARPVIWNPFDISRADFDDFIDVKGVSRFTDHLMIQHGTMRLDCAYQMVFATNHPVYVIGNWCWGREIADRPYEIRNKDRGPAIWVRADDPIMKRPEQLHEIMLIRQRVKYGLELDEIWLGPEPEPT